MGFKILIASALLGTGTVVMSHTVDFVAAETADDVPHADNLPSNFKLITGKDGSWKIVPKTSDLPQDFGLLSEAQLDQMQASDQMNPDAVEALLSSLNHYNATIFSHTPVSQGALDVNDNALLVDGNIELSDGVGLGLGSKGQTVMLTGDLFAHAKSNNFRILGDGNLVFTANHGITGSGVASSSLMKFLKEHPSQIHGVPSFSDQYFNKLYQSTIALSQRLSSDAKQVADHNPVSGTNLYPEFSLDEAHWNAKTNAYYYSIDGKRFNHIFPAITVHGQSKHSGAKLVVTVTGSDEINISGMQVYTDGNLSVDRDHFLLNIPDSLSIQASGASEYLRPHLRVIAPKASIDEIDAFMIGAYKRFGGNVHVGDNPFIPNESEGNENSGDGQGNSGEIKPGDTNNGGQDNSGENNGNGQGDGNSGDGQGNSGDGQGNSGEIKPGDTNNGGQDNSGENNGNGQGDDNSGDGQGNPGEIKPGDTNDGGQDNSGENNGNGQGDDNSGDGQGNSGEIKPGDTNNGGQDNSGEIKPGDTNNGDKGNSGDNPVNNNGQGTMGEDKPGKTPETDTESHPEGNPIEQPGSGHDGGTSIPGANPGKGPHELTKPNQPSKTTAHATTTIRPASHQDSAAKHTDKQSLPQAGDKQSGILVSLGLLVIMVVVGVWFDFKQLNRH